MLTGAETVPPDHPELVEFARRLVRHVRDEAINSCDRNLSKSARHVIAKRWREAASGDSVEFARTLIPDIVDEVMFYLLHSIDDGLLPLCYLGKSGQIDLNAKGESELAGWYLGGDGWRNRYSKERYKDYHSDLGSA